MKKRTLISLIAVFAILIAFGTVALGIYAQESKPTLEIKAANLEFQDTVYILYAVGDTGLSETERANIELLVWYDDPAITVDTCVKGSEKYSLKPSEREHADVPDGCQVFELRTLAAAEMTKDIYARAYVQLENGEVYSPIVKYSVLKYAMNKLGYTGAATENVKLKNMLEAMLVYGAMAQELFGVETDRLATDMYAEVKLDGATFADGMDYGLYKIGEEVKVYAPTTAEKPYVIYKDEKGNAHGTGAEMTLTVSKNVELTAALSSAEPTYGAYKHVVVVGMDGAGNYFKDIDTPNFDSIFAEGAVTYYMRTTSPTISAAAWASCLHGADTFHTGIVENTPVEEPTAAYPADKVPSFLKVAYENNPAATNAVALYTWIGIQGVVEDMGGVRRVRSSDAGIASGVGDYIDKNKNNVIFIHLNDPDAVGHSSGYGTEAQYTELKSVDQQIKDIYTALENAGIADDTLFIVTADHGGRPSGTGGTHGSLTDGEKYVVFAAKGKTVKAGGNPQGMKIRDVAAVALYGLGIVQPEAYTATVPGDLFEGVDAIARPVYHDPSNPRDVVSTETPEKDTEGYITSFVGNDILSYLTFDNSMEAEIGTNDAIGHGDIAWEEGYFGSAVNLDDGYLELDGFAPANKSFTVSVWVKTPSAYGTSVLMTNKAWNTAAAGFSLSFLRTTPNQAQFNIANGSSYLQQKHDLPEDYKSGWMHVMLIVDRENNLASVCYDFGELISYDISYLGTGAFSDGTKLYFGDTANNEAYSTINKMGLAIDELIVFDGALDRAAINSVVKYYGAEIVVKDITNLIEDKPLDVYLPFNGSVENLGANKNATVTAGGELGYVENGYVDGAADFNGKSATDGNRRAVIDNYELGTDDFSIAFWMNSLNCDDPVIIGTQDWDKGTSPGFVVARVGGVLRVNMADGTTRVNVKFALPENYEGKWTHVVLTFDRTNGKVGCSYNFGEFVYDSCIAGIPSTFGITGPIVIGDDYNGYGQYLKAQLDEMMIFRGALNADDVATLEEYYAALAGGEEPDGGVSGGEDSTANIFGDGKEPEIFLEFDNNAKNNGTESTTVVVVGDIEYAEGKDGNSAYFTGENAVVLPELKLGTEDFFVAAWINPTDLTNWSGNRYKLPIVSTASDVNRNIPGFNVMLDIEHKYLAVTWSDGQGHDFEVRTTVDMVAMENEWSHVIVATDKANSKIRVYLNFELLAEVPFNHNSGGVATTTPLPNLSADVNPFTIGEYGIANEKHAALMYIDDVIVCKRVLTDADITALKNYYGAEGEEPGGNTGSGEEPGGNTGSGDQNSAANAFADTKKPEIFFDFNNNTENTGTESTTVKVVGNIEYATGNLGNAAYFSGTNAVVLPDLKLGDEDFAVAVWINPTDVTNWGGSRYKLPIISTAADVNRNAAGINLMLDIEDRANNPGGGTIIVTWSDGKGNDFQITSAFVKADFENKWNHIVLATDKDNNALKVYVNFELVLDVKITLSIGGQPSSTELPNMTADANPFTIGELGVASSFNDAKIYIDDLMVFKRMFTAEDVLTLKSYYENPNGSGNGNTGGEQPGGSEDTVTFGGVDNALNHYLGFNENVSEDAGKGTQTYGELTYEDGKDGKAVNLSEGYVGLNEFNPATNSFTVGFWLNVKEYSAASSAEFILFASQDWNSSVNPGFNLMYSKGTGGLKIRAVLAENTNYRAQFNFEIADYTLGDWIYIVFVVDRDNGKYKLSYNFGEFVEQNISNDRNANLSMENVSASSNNTFKIGQDGVGAWRYYPQALMDEFVIFDGALDATDIAALQNYYAGEQSA